MDPANKSRDVGMGELLMAVGLRRLVEEVFSANGKVQVQEKIWSFSMCSVLNLDKWRLVCIIVDHCVFCETQLCLLILN